METVDWALLVVLLALVGWGNKAAARHNRSIADFLAANRAAGPYLLATADGTAGLGDPPSPGPHPSPLPHPHPARARTKSPRPAQAP